MSIEKARETINTTDGEMARLFCERLEASRHIADEKIKQGAAVLNPEREKEVIENGMRNIPEELRRYYFDFITGVIGISRDLQYKRVADCSPDTVYCPAGRYCIYTGEGALEKHISSFDLSRRVLVLT